MNFADELKTKFDLFEVPKLKQALTVNIRACVRLPNISGTIYYLCI